MLSKAKLSKWWHKWKNRHNKNITNFTIRVSDGLAVSAYSTILDMKGNCKQEGVVLHQIKRCSRSRAEVIPLMWGDSPEEVIERIKPSLA